MLFKSCQQPPWGKLPRVLYDVILSNVFHFCCFINCYTNYFFQKAIKQPVLHAVKILIYLFHHVSFSYLTKNKSLEVLFQFQIKYLHLETSPQVSCQCFWSQDAQEEPVPFNVTDVQPDKAPLDLRPCIRRHGIQHTSHGLLLWCVFVFSKDWQMPLYVTTEKMFHRKTTVYRFTTINDDNIFILG